MFALTAISLAVTLGLGHGKFSSSVGPSIYKLHTHRAHRDGLLVVPEQLRKVTEFANFDLKRRTDLAKKERADPSHVHEVIFEVAHVKHAELEMIALDVSDPDSPNYGKHWTRQQIADFLDCYGSQKAIASYLTSQNIEIVEQSPWGDEITAKAPIAVWEQVFSTTFHNFEQRRPMSNTRREGVVVPETVVSEFVRALQYTLPAEIEEHVEAAFNTVQFSPRSVHGHHVVDLPSTESNLRRGNGLKKTEDALPSSYTDLFQGYITPAVLNSYYGVDSNSGSALTSQAVYETNGQTMSPESQKHFQINYDLPQQSPAANVGGHVDSAACRQGGGAECSEANANIQYLMGMSQDTPTTFWYDNRGDVRMWINRVARSANPPDLISITYICTETDVISALGSDTVVSSYTTSFDKAAIVLALQGTTLVIGTGDDGAVGYNTIYGGEGSCQYNADFPATSPYVTAVGTTVGPENNLPEVACSGLSGTISSGGGFSLIYGQPSWQTQAVNAYFVTAAAKGVLPAPGYDAGNRAVPDITGAGNVYIMVNAGNFQALAGSSLSAPFVASLIALGNAARKENGLSTFGWLNPLFYKKNKIFRDVTSGSNECTSYGKVCCSQGFTAVKGWDPVSGWGSIDFQKFKTNYFNYQYNSGDFLPNRHTEGLETHEEREMSATNMEESSTMDSMKSPFARSPFAAGMAGMSFLIVAGLFVLFSSSSKNRDNTTSKDVTENAEDKCTHESESQSLSLLSDKEKDVESQSSSLVDIDTDANSSPMDAASSTTLLCAMIVALEEVNLDGETMMSAEPRAAI